MPENYEPTQVRRSIPPRPADRGTGWPASDVFGMAECPRVRQLLPPPADPSAQVELAALYAPPAGRFVRVNFVSSLDGAAEVDGRSGPLGGAADKQVFHTLRSLCDVVLVGAGTARAENYGPAKVPGRSPGEQPPLALVSRSLELARDSRFFTEPGARPLIVTTASASAPDWLGEVADLVIAGQDDVDLTSALDQLADRGLRSVLCEGGPRLFGDLAAAGVVDELCLTIAPLLAGPDRKRILGGPAWRQPVPLSLVSAIEADDVLLLRYAVTR